MKIPSETISVLSTLEIDGNSVRIPGQLDRKLYEKVNKVLEACGGKWNRKAKAHLFSEDATGHVETVLATGEITTAREIGFFPTSALLAIKLVKRAGVAQGDVVLEPSAGTGRIVAAAFAAGATVWCIERDEKMRDTLRRQLSAYAARLKVSNHDDFMDYAGDMGQVDKVVMNPPFTKCGKGDHLDHVQHAFTMLKPGGRLVSVLPSSVDFRTDRRHTAFRAWIEDNGGEITSLPDGSFKESGTGVNTCVLTIEKCRAA